MAANIFTFLSAQKYLAAEFAKKKASRPSFSIRAWAQALGLKSHTALHAVVSGDRKTPLSLYVPLANNLKLSQEESHYFLILINFENAKDQYSRMMLLDKLETLRKHKNFSVAQLTEFDLLSDPFWGLLMEMTDLKDFIADPAAIRERSRLPKSNKEIKDAIDVLLQNGFLKVENGELKKTHAHVTNSADVANLGSRKYHKNVSMLASEQLEAQDVNEREFNGYALNIRTRDIPKMKESLRAFIRQFILEFEAERGEGDATYQFNAQFFNLTRIK